MVGVHVTNESVVDDRKHIEKIRIHPRYNYLNADYDFSILFLTSPLDFSSNTIGPVCLPASTQSRYTGQEAKVIGWGLTSSDGSSASKLQEVDVTVMTNHDCNNWYPNMIERYQASSVYKIS